MPIRGGLAYRLAYMNSAGEWYAVINPWFEPSFMVPQTGLEPVTYGLEGRRSIH